MQPTTPDAASDDDALFDALVEAMEADPLPEAAPVAQAAPQAEAAPPAEAVSPDAFAALARKAAAELGGTLLFSICVGPDEARRHVATARLGEGEAQEFVLLTMPAAGGTITTEPAASSDEPVARIAAAYAGLAEALDRAA
jgi:hypothetical protein